MTTPRISILLPVYNAGPFIGRALQSILNQTFTNFELLLINDGSTDNSADEIQKAAQNDPRLHLITRENRGLIATLNEGLSLAKGDYIARMDADDIAFPTRLAEQITFLDAHPAIAVLGTQTESFHSAAPGQLAPHFSTLSNYPTDPDTLLCTLIFRNPLAHPTTMLRRELFSRHRLSYDPTAKHTEDYALWLQIANLPSPTPHQLANLPIPLLRYRIHSGQVCQQHQGQQQETTTQLQLTFIQQRLHITATPEERTTHAALAFNQFQPTPAFLTAATNWLEKLAQANSQLNSFPQTPFLRTLTGRLVTLTRYAQTQNLSIPTTPSLLAPFINP